MEIDFSSVSNVSDYVTVPAGTYLCKIAEVQTGSTRNGDERWGIRLVVAEGEYVGRQAAWDSLVFSTRGMGRVRHVLDALGLPTSGRVQIEPDHLTDLPVFVEVRPVDYEHPDTGTVVRRNEVPYEGYTRVRTDSEESTTARNGADLDGDADSSMPF